MWGCMLERSYVCTVQLLQDISFKSLPSGCQPAGDLVDDLATKAAKKTRAGTVPFVFEARLGACICPSSLVLLPMCLAGVGALATKVVHRGCSNQQAKEQGGSFGHGPIQAPVRMDCVGRRVA